MLIGSDCELSLALGHDDSSRKALSEIMLKQEEIFRKQVLELHQLYQTQKILMKEVEMKVDCGENSHAFSGPFSNHLKCEYTVAEKKLGEDWRTSMSNQLRPLDLQLSARHSTNKVEELSPRFRNYGCVASRISSTLKYEVCVDKVSYMEGLALSLGAHSHSLTNQNRSSKDDSVCPQSRPATGYAVHAMAASGKCDASGKIFESSLVTNGGQKLEENNGGIGCQNENTSVKRNLFASCEFEQLDLNKPISEESSDHWGVPLLNSSKVSSMDTLHDAGSLHGESTCLNDHDSNKPANDSLNELSRLDQKDAANSMLTITFPDKCRCEGKEKDAPGSALATKDVGSICRSPLESADYVRFPGKFKHKTVGCKEGKTFQKRFTSEIEIHDSRDKEDKLHLSNSSQELVEATDSSNKSPVSCKSCIVDDESSSSKTGRCGTDMLYSDHSLVQQNVEPTVGVKDGACGQEKLDVMMVRQGALSLICLSTKSKEQAPVCTGIFKEVEKEVVQSSSESYESLVLKQQDCSGGEYCVSSTALEATSWNEEEKEECGVKVRRGRRMKDFRKEVLPCLSSLSRQEINEDIKILELAWRSRLREREGNKFKSKNNNNKGRGGGCFSAVPVRSRKSTLRQVHRSRRRRRCYS
ncbi:uncharacterized protein LOC127256022 [Andrographis paniculata]|uniref:uncharacterized protein LOC127256022 n=1 Tax=Andrographis paniculata TaxID=175694 RepID=UPI0021E837AF|nr:uncharacterized protein LOC127256022 [Andrographis paniculata]